LENIARFFRERLPGVEHELVVIDNALPCEHRERIDDRRTIIGGDNSRWEFSGWDQGLRFLGQRILDLEFVHLATSAYQELYTAYIERLDEEMLSFVVGRGAAVGHIGYYDSPVALLGRPCQSWLRTSFLFMPPTELRLLGSLVSVSDGSVFFSGDPARPFREDAPISDNYKQCILGWLTGSGTGQGVSWHSRFDLSATTIEMFEAKTLAILNEMMLTVRLRTQGCATVDATWLSARVKQLRATGGGLGPIPDWVEQITTRDVGGGKLNSEVLV